MKALIVREPYLGRILAGSKTWELRSRPCSHRGLTGLIRKGSKAVVGVVKISQCLPPLNDMEIRQSEKFHGIPPDEIDALLKTAWRVPWVLEEVCTLARPINYSHSSQVTWVDLSIEETALVVEQLRGKANISTTKPQYVQSFGMTCPPKGQFRTVSVRDAVSQLPHLSGWSNRSITESKAEIITSDSDLEFQNGNNKKSDSLRSEVKSLKQKIIDVFMK